jgi:hypothetical protein
MADLDDIEAAISESANRIIAAINNRPNYLITLFWIAVGAVGWALVSRVSDAIWQSKARYSFQYSTVSRFRRALMIVVSLLLR